MKKQWQDFLFDNASDLAILVSRLERALEKGDIKTANDLLVALWVKHGITVDDDGNLHHVISFDFVNDRVRLEGIKRNE